MLSAACGGGGIDERSYVEGNERLLDNLPVYPGAKRTHEDASVGYPAATQALIGTKIGGYMTDRYYELPAGTTCGHVEDWYGMRLGTKRVGGVNRPDWSAVTGGDYDVSWVKGSALAEIVCSTGNGSPTLMVRADYNERKAG